jgi:putative ABC transport system permease protein
VIAYSVAERTREIGIRAALGASSRDIVRLVVGGGMAVVGAGLGAGVGVALALTRYLEGSLFNVSATDPSTFGAVGVVLMLVALAAQTVPVFRAMRVNPTVALKAE